MNHLARAVTKLRPRTCLATSAVCRPSKVSRITVPFRAEAVSFAVRASKKLLMASPLSVTAIDTSAPGARLAAADLFLSPLPFCPDPESRSEAQADTASESSLKESRLTDSILVSGA